MSDDLKLHYYAATQVNKVRFVMVFSLLVGAGLLYLAYVAARYYELESDQAKSARIKGRRLPFIIDGQGFYVRWKNDTEFDLESAS